MSIEQNVTETIQVVAVKDRTHAIHMRTLYGSDYELQAMRERIWLAADGTVVKREPLPDVVRRLSQVQAEPESLALLATVRDRIDFWAQQDAAPAPEPDAE